VVTSFFHKHRQQTVAGFFFFLLLAATAGCGSEEASEPETSSETNIRERIENELTFDDVTLKQLNSAGERLWTVEAIEAAYNQSRSVASVKNPQGDLYQEGQVAYEVEGDTGTIYEDGKKIVLQGNVIAKQKKDGAVLYGDEMEWYPQQDLLLVRGNLRGVQEQTEVLAKEGKVYNQQSRVELSGDVVMTDKDARVRLKTQQVVWELDAERASSETQVNIERYAQDNPEQIRDRATANRGEVQLDQEIATLQQNAEVVLGDPPITVNSDRLEWNIQQATVNAPTAVTMFHRQQEFTLQGDQGLLDLQQRTLFAKGNVVATSALDESRLESNRLLWNLEAETFTATGEVFYRQSDPAMTSTGPQAKGRLQEQQIVLEGGRVVTEIVP
jgi:LPS export ABC transporter protein LptC